jgi:hypothetical protein
MLAGSQTAILCSDVVQAGAAFIAPPPRKKGRGRDGAGRERALRVPMKPFGCLFCCLGQLGFHDLKIFFPRQKP